MDLRFQLRDLGKVTHPGINVSVFAHVVRFTFRPSSLTIRALFIHVYFPFNLMLLTVDQLVTKICLLTFETTHPW